MDEPLAIILAAGQGTRMGSDLPKVLLEVCGRPMVCYVLDAVREAGISRLLLVIGYRRELVRDALAEELGVEFVEQRERLGTGHAVRMCRDQLAAHDGPVVVLAGDSPFVQASSIRGLLACYLRDRPACVLGTARKDDPSGLGRIVRDEAGEFLEIVEERDASASQRAIREVNMSTYVFDSRALVGALDGLTTGNAVSEYYLTDCPGLFRRDGCRVVALPILKPCESLSINTRYELALAEAEMARRRAGVSTPDG
jgi:bifunctional UDP-N-acetylglucosamine pyrophosphorylase/glucosamine-1-phosphate N-acetyltransferase/UDP-N-acetylglucosamine pyrophosphorylase